MAIITFGEAVKKAGIKPTEVKSLGVGLAPSEKPRQGFMKDAVADLDQIGTDIRKTTKDTVGKIQGATDAYANDDQSILRSLGQAFGIGAGGVASILGDLFKGGGKAILPQGAEDKVKDKAVEIAAPIFDNEKVKGVMDKYESLPDDKKRDVDALLGLASLGSEFVGAGAAKETAIQGAKVAKKTVELAGDAIKAGEEAIAPALDAAGNVIKGTKDVIGMGMDAAGRIPNKIAINTAEKQAQREAIEKLPSITAKQAAQDGVDLPDVTTVFKVKEAVPAQKKIARELVETAKAFAKDKGLTDPIEIIGKPIVQRLGVLEKGRQKVGEALGAASKQLGTVTTKELANPVFNALKKVPGLQGLEVSPKGALNFTKTTLASAMTKADRLAIQKAFIQAVRGGSGEQKHLFRQELFEILGGKKKSLSNITDTQEKAFDAIREGLSGVLETKNPSYKTLSNQYRKIIQPLKDMRKAMKAGGHVDEDILQMKAGILARRLTSLAPSGTDIRQMLRSMDAALGKKSNTTFKVEELQDLYNVLDRYYDLAPKTGFKNQVKEGFESAGGVKDAILGKVKEFAGETAAVRQKALERMFEEVLK